MDISVDNLDFYYLTLRDTTGNTLDFNLKDELAINEQNLLQEMLEQPSKYIYWSSILETLKMYQEAKEIELETVVANLDPQARNVLKESDIKPTKDMVDAYIKRQETYTTKKNEVLYMSYIVGRVQRIVKAFEQRSSMLQSYGKQVLENKAYGHGAGSRIEDTPPPYGYD